jgi:RNA polymerase sigma-70 factor (ECF subfamily)
VLAGAHGAAAALLWSSWPAWPWGIVASAVIAFSLTFTLRREALRLAAAAVARIELAPDGAVELLRRDGSVLRGRLLGSSFVSPVIVILNLRVRRWRPPLAVPLPADCLPREAHRRLRVWLRWRGAAAVQATGVAPTETEPPPVTELTRRGPVCDSTARPRFRTGLPGSILGRFARSLVARFLLAPEPYGPHSRMSDREIDQQLVERAQRGDKRAFELLVAKYQRKLARLLSRFVRDAAEVEDVTQEAFIKAYRALPSFRGDSAFYTWLYRIGINTAKNYLVSLGRRAPTTTEFDSEDAENFEDGDQLRDLNTPENELMSKQIAKTVNETMEALPEELRTAIALREIDGLSYEEIATVMNCPIGTVRSRIFRARESIAERLRPLLETSKDKRW